jgi:hypothetical protein
MAQFLMEINIEAFETAAGLVASGAEPVRRREPLISRTPRQGSSRKIDLVRDQAGFGRRGQRQSSREAILRS